MNSETLENPFSANPFDVLGIDETASSDEIKKAYFRMVRQFSPEKHAEQFKRIREAYDLLKDPTLRLEAEVFRPINPPSLSVSEDAELPPISLDGEIVLRWMRSTLTDLERTDFTSDFNEVL